MIIATILILLFIIIIIRKFQNQIQVIAFSYFKVTI